MFCRCPSASGEHGGPLPAEGAAGTFLVRGWIPWEPGYPADGNANLLNALPQPLPAMLLLIKLNLIMQITHPTLTHIRGTYLLPAPAVSFLQQTHQLLFRVHKQARAKPAAPKHPSFLQQQHEESSRALHRAGTPGSSHNPINFEPSASKNQREGAASAAVQLVAPPHLPSQTARAAFTGDSDMERMRCCSSPAGNLTVTPKSAVLLPLRKTSCISLQG